MRSAALFSALFAAVASAAGEGSVRGTGSVLEPLYPDDRELALFAEARRSDVATARAERLDRSDVAARMEMRAEVGDARSAEMRSDEIGAARSAEMRSDVEIKAARLDDYDGRVTDARAVDARLDDGRVDARLDARLDDEKVVMEKNPYDVPILP